MIGRQQITSKVTKQLSFSREEVSSVLSIKEMQIQQIKYVVSEPLHCLEEASSEHFLFYLFIVKEVKCCCKMEGIKLLQCINVAFII